MTELTFSAEDDEIKVPKLSVWKLETYAFSKSLLDAARQFWDVGQKEKERCLRVTP